MLRRSIVVVLAAVTALALSAGPVAAVPLPFDPPQTVIGGCESYSADAVMRNGVLTGFATCGGGNIRFLSRNANRSVNPSEATGFVGTVMGVASDSTASYVLYFNGSQILIGKRTNAGAYSTRVVDTFGGGGLLPTGDVIAQNGQWFGVWSEQVGPGGEFAQTDLFFASSSLSPAPVPPGTSALDDLQPTLAYSDTTPVLIWTQWDSPAIPGPSDLMVSKYISGSWQATRVFASAGTFNMAPDIHIAGGRTFVAWERDGFVWVASNATGSFVSHMFNVGGNFPKVAASTTSGFVDHVFVTWTAFDGFNTRAFFAQTNSTGSVTGNWSGDYIAGSPTFVVGAGGYATKGTSVFTTPSEVVARSQS